jgi:hypothetical protein
VIKWAAGEVPKAAQIGPQPLDLGLAVADKRVQQRVGLHQVIAFRT